MLEGQEEQKKACSVSRPGSCCSSWARAQVHALEAKTISEQASPPLGLVLQKPPVLPERSWDARAKATSIAGIAVAAVMREPSIWPLPEPSLEGEWLLSSPCLLICHVCLRSAEPHQNPVGKEDAVVVFCLSSPMMRKCEAGSQHRLNQHDT